MDRAVYAVDLNRTFSSRQSASPFQVLGSRQTCHQGGVVIKNAVRHGLTPDTTTALHRGSNLNKRPQPILIMVCGSHTGTVAITKSQVNAMMDLTCQHKDQTLLVEGPEIKVRSVGADSWSMHDRFSAEDLQTVIDLYISRTTSSQVAQRFGISVSSVKRVLRDHGIRKRAPTTRS
jgi:Helix-turn-helix domain of resolvase